MLWITESPRAASAASNIAIPARMSGLSTTWPRSGDGPAITARWGSHSTMRAPIPMSLSTKKSRDSNSFSKMSNSPSHCVATTIAIDIRSAGNWGQGPSSSSGTWPPRSARMRRSWLSSTTSFAPSSRGRTPSRSNASSVAQQGGAGRRRRGNEDVLGGRDARFVEEDVRRPQAPSRCLELVVVAHGDLGAHLLQREEVGVHTPASDHVAAGGRESNAAEAGEHRPGKEDGGPDAPAQCGIELARGGVRRIDLDRMIAAPADVRAEMDE